MQNRKTEKRGKNPHPSPGVTHGGSTPWLAVRCCLMLTRKRRIFMRIINKCIPLVTAAALLVGTVGCENLPGNKQSQGAVIGGATGAAVGAAVAKNNLLGALIGGLLGAGGGVLIWAHVVKITGKETAGAGQAKYPAQLRAAPPRQGQKATPAARQQQRL